MADNLHWMSGRLESGWNRGYQRPSDFVIQLDCGTVTDLKMWDPGL